MRKFPEIGQFRHVVDNVVHKATYIGQSAEDEPMYDETRPKPILKFHGLTKLHGTNCGVRFEHVGIQDGSLWTTDVLCYSAQSRERELTVEEDNFGFCAWTLSEPGQASMLVLGRLAWFFAATYPGVTRDRIKAVTVFGEWCGPGVNGKTAIGRLPARWVCFGAVVELTDGTEFWLDMEKLADAWKIQAEVIQHDAMANGELVPLYFISDYTRWELQIDFNRPEAALDSLEALTLAVEAACPVAAAFGGEGIGEGIVWTCNDKTYGRQVFKTKGAKHKGTRTSKLVDIAPEVLASRQAFVEAVLTESRLEQGFDLMRALHGKVTRDCMGEYLQWVGQDVLKEESDTLIASGLERKDVMNLINKRAKDWVWPKLEKV